MGGSDAGGALRPVRRRGPHERGVAGGLARAVAGGGARRSGGKTPGGARWSPREPRAARDGRRADAQGPGTGPSAQGLLVLRWAPRGTLGAR